MSASNSNATRQTAKQVHLKRKEVQENTLKRNACFMIGTQLVDLLRKGSLPSSLPTPLDIAESVNRIFETKKEEKLLVSVVYICFENSTSTKMLTMISFLMQLNQER